MTAAASAITAPTERSMPSVPITSAMPSATTMHRGTTCTNWVRKLSTAKKFAVNNSCTEKQPMAR